MKWKNRNQGTHPLPHQRALVLAVGGLEAGNMSLAGSRAWGRWARAPAESGGKPTARLILLSLPLHFLPITPATTFRAHYFTPRVSQCSNSTTPIVCIRPSCRVAGSGRAQPSSPAVAARGGTPVGPRPRGIRPLSGTLRRQMAPQRPKPTVFKSNAGLSLAV